MSKTPKPPLAGGVPSWPIRLKGVAPHCPEQIYIGRSEAEILGYTMSCYHHKVTQTPQQPRRVPMRCASRVKGRKKTLCPQRYSLHRQMQKHFSVWYYIFPLIYGNLTSRIYFKLLASPLFFGYRWKLETECETHQRLSWLHTRITWEILNIGAQDALTEYSDLIPQGGHPNNGH